MATLFARGQTLNARAWRAAAIFETVTLSIRGAGDTYLDYGCIRAERRSMDKRDLRVGSGQVNAATIVFHIPVKDEDENPKDLDADVEITNHSKVTDYNNVVYFLELPRLETNRSRWRCETVREA